MVLLRAHSIFFCLSILPSEVLPMMLVQPPSPFCFNDQELKSLSSESLGDGFSAKPADPVKKKKKGEKFPIFSDLNIFSAAGRAKHPDALESLRPDKRIVLVYCSVGRNYCELGARKNGERSTQTQ
jgi:hypothetical protein